MKKLLSIILTLSFAILRTYAPVYAWAPTDYDDIECIDLRELGKTKDLIMLGKSGEKVCGCAMCTVDAVLYNRLEDYMDELKTRFDALLNVPEISSWDRILVKLGSTRERRKIIETWVKLLNLENILQEILNYENKKFTDTSRDFLLVSANNDPNNPSSISQLAKLGGITYKIAYNESYFGNIKKDKVLPLLNQIQVVLKNNYNFDKL